MAKLKQENITKKDIDEYLNKYSDFSFEIKVLNKFSKLKFKCTHSGSYVDPATSKFREFDIRATKRFQNSNVKLAIECKNLTSSFPLVAHCLKRSKDESYHNVITTDPYHKRSSTSYNPLIEKYDYKSSIYKANEFAAKSFDQIGRHITEGTIIKNDVDSYDKMTQAVNSSKDLVLEAVNEIDPNTLQFIILPLLVIPDNTLWAIFYDGEGNITKEPELLKHISYYIGRSWPVNKKFNSVYTISHLDIITFSYIEEFINRFLDGNNDWDDIFLK